MSGVGEFKDVASLRKTDGDDEVYFITQRSKLEQPALLSTGWMKQCGTIAVDQSVFSYASVIALVSHAGKLYAGCYGSGEIFVSSDLGVTWTLEATLPGGPCYMVRLVSFGGVLYAVTKNADGIIYRQDAAGEWSAAASIVDISNTSDAWTGAFVIGDHFYAWHNPGAVIGNWLSRTADFVTWEWYSASGTWIDETHANADYQLFGTADSSLFTDPIEVDGTWYMPIHSQSNVGRPGTGIWTSNDDGETWTHISTQEYATGFCHISGDTFAIAGLTQAARRQWWISRDKCLTWAALPDTAWAACHWIYAWDGVMFYGGDNNTSATSGGVYVSVDEGTTWGSDLVAGNCSLGEFHLIFGGLLFAFSASSAYNAGAIYRGVGPVFTDGGYYIETLAERVTDPDSADCIFLDCAIQYSGSLTTTLTGLGHLDGMKVWVLSAGVLQTTYNGDPLVVVDGALTLDSGVAEAVIGLPYTADVETLPLELQQGTTSMGRLKAARTMVLRVNETKGFLIGPDSDRLTTPGEWEELTASEVFTGELEHRIKGDWNTLGHVFIRQEQPFPMTIQAIVNFVETE